MSDSTRCSACVISLLVEEWRGRWEEAQELRAEDKKRCTCKYSSLVAGQTKRYSPCQSRSRDGNGHKDDKEVMMKEGTAKLVNTVTDLLHE